MTDFECLMAVAFVCFYFIVFRKELNSRRGKRDE